MVGECFNHWRMRFWYFFKFFFSPKREDCCPHNPFFFCHFDHVHIFCSVFGWQMRKLNLNTLFLAMTCVSTPPVSGIMISMFNSLSPYCQGIQFCPHCFPSSNFSLALWPWLSVSCINSWHCQTLPCFCSCSYLVQNLPAGSQQCLAQPRHYQPRSFPTAATAWGVVVSSLGTSTPLPWALASAGPLPQSPQPPRATSEPAGWGFPQTMFLDSLDWIL